jgi:hypothetical protein
VPVDKVIVLTNQGNVYDKAKLEDIKDELRVQEGEIIVKERSVKTWKVESYIMNGAEILSGPFEWAGRLIPLIPVYGKRAKIENQEYIRGIVRFAKDPQRVLNYAESQKIEVSALSPKDPYWATKKQAEGNTAQWARMNVSNDPVLFYTPDEKVPGPPTRGGAPQLQSALIEQAQSAAENVVAAMGIQTQALRSVGATGIDRRSEEAVIAQQQLADLSTFEYFDNLIEAIRHTGEVIIDLTPRIYDAQRQVTILKPDGTEELVEINKTVTDTTTGERTILNNLRQGKYSVSVTTGPAFTTKRLESVNQLQKFAEENPALAPLIADLIVKNFDTLDSEEILKRVKEWQISSGTRTATEEEREELGIDQIEQIKQQLIPQLVEELRQDATVRTLHAQADQLEAAAQKAMSDVQLNGGKLQEILAGIRKTISEADKVDIEANKTALEAAAQQLENFLKQQQIGIPLGVVDHVERLDQQDLVDITQAKVSEPLLQQ